MNCLNNNVIAYTIDRALNNSFYISVQNGEVLVKAPWYFSREKIEEIIEEKKKWISEKLRQYENENIKKRNYIKNNKVKILGKNFDLKVVYSNVKLPKLNVENNLVEITIPTKYKKMDNSDIIGILIEKMYDQIAEKEIETSMEKMRVIMGIAPEDFEIKRMKNILGLCTQDKKIIVNPDIAVYDKNVIDYIVLHEYCHLKYKNHTRSFYELLKKYMPEYEKSAEKISNLKY